MWKNLLTETIEVLEENWKSPTDVSWVGALSYGCFSWRHFKKIANVGYDPDSGSFGVAEDLLVVGEGWWLERRLVDGVEFWVFKQFPCMPDSRLAQVVVDEYASSLDEMNS